MIDTVTRTLALRFGSGKVIIESEEPAILARLERYFHAFIDSPRAKTHSHSLIRAIEDRPASPDAGLIPWEPKGKESFADRPDGRYVLKVRTGVSMDIEEDSWSSTWTVRGPILHNFSQLINVVGTLYGLSVLDHGGAMVHASAVSREGRAIAVMANSGMGKSSVAVRLMEQGFDYISNDRLILEPAPDRETVVAHGLPKLPRVNPGTLLDGERTRLLLSSSKRQRYGRLTKEELWQVEDKYDVEVEGTLGRRWLLSGSLVCALVLDWRGDGEGLELQRLTPGQALEEMRLVRKTFGPFDLRLAQRRDTALVETATRVPVYRVTGRADPANLARELASGRLKDLT